MGKKIVTFGEILLRLTVPQNLRFSQTDSYIATFGGSEANVAVSLSSFGLDTEYITRLPKNEIAQACISTLRSHNVGVDRIIYGGDRMGIYFMENGAVSRQSNVVYDRNDSAYASLEPGMIDWREVFKDATWFHWSGIAAAISESGATVCREGIKIAKEMGLTISCDLNYRAKLWEYGKLATDVIPKMAAQSNVIFGSDAEYAKIFQIKPVGFKAQDANYKIDLNGYKEMMDQAAAKCPDCKKFFVALRNEINSNHNTFGGMLYKDGKMTAARVYDVTHIVDKVGVGDAFVGGMIFGLNTYDDDLTTLNFATACGAIKNTIYGDFNLVSREEIETLMKGDGSGRVSR